MGRPERVQVAQPVPGALGELARPTKSGPLVREYLRRPPAETCCACEQSCPHRVHAVEPWIGGREFVPGRQRFLLNSDAFGHCSGTGARAGRRFPGRTIGLELQLGLRLAIVAHQWISDPADMARP